MESCSFFNEARHRFRWLELAAIGAGQRVRDLLPVFDNAGFNKLPPPASRMIKPQKNWRFPRLLSSPLRYSTGFLCLKISSLGVSSHFRLEIDFRGLRMVLQPTENYSLMMREREREPKRWCNIFVNLIILSWV